MGAFINQAWEIILTFKVNIDANYQYKIQI